MPRAPVRQIGGFEPAWDAVTGAVWLHVDQRGLRVFVWRGGDKVSVYSTLTAELRTEWLLQHDRPPTPQTVRDTVLERIAAGY